MNTDELATASASPEIAEHSTTIKRVVRIRLYIAKSTPNSTRAEHNISAALKMWDDEDGCFELEVIDVFVHPKQAITDGVMVTPTLVGLRANGRSAMVGDLSDSAKLQLLLESLVAPTPASGADATPH